MNDGIGGKKVIDKDGIIVILADDNAPSTPLFCPVCVCPMKNADDVSYYTTYSCCFMCGIKWAESNRIRWAEGWRPDVAIITKEVSLRRARRKMTLKKTFRGK